MINPSFDNLQAIYKEMPTVPKSIALIRNCPEATEFKMTKRELLKDIKVESKPKKTFAFGTSLPKRLRFIPSRHSNWLKCKNVPHDLETMDAVWNGIKNLDSVRGFADWLETHLNVSSNRIIYYQLLAILKNNNFILKCLNLFSFPKTYLQTNYLYLSFPKM